MSLILRRLFATSLILLLQACMAIGPRFEAGPNPSAEASLIYVFRPANFTNSAITPDLFVDNVEIAALTNGGYVAITLKPGPHRIHLSLPGWKGEAAVVAVTKGGERTYLRVLTGNQVTYPLRTRTFTLKQATEEDARVELSETRRVANVDLKQ